MSNLEFAVFCLAALLIFLCCLIFLVEGVIEKGLETCAGGLEEALAAALVKSLGG